MNTYKITFQRENGTTGTDRFTAATEAQARRDFKEVYRHGNGTITSVELVSTDTPATKEQERKAVEKIRKIVSELGEGSYVGTALEGCLEDAESNIENDFGDSMKRRWEYAEAQLKMVQEEIASLKNELAESKKDYDAAHAAAHEIAEQKDAEIEALRKQVLEADDLESLLILAIERKTALDEEAKNAAERIVESAGEPESAAFKNAVSDHRAAKRAAEKYTALIERASKAKR
jgi:DNA repair exonuclease SbcCD ATPase subunit